MTSRRAINTGLAFGALAALGGCASLAGPIRVPLDVIRDDRGCAGTLSAALLVFLPGAHMAPVELLREGFVAAVRERNLAVDLVLPDSNLGYVYDGSVLQHLHDDVIAPALAQGRREIWLAGISLGGALALGYAMRHPRQIAGVLAIAPYLGRPTLLQQIAAAGGAAAWRLAAPPAAAGDIDSAMWRWLADPQRGAPPIWLAYGTEDRLAAGHALLAPLLPPARVTTVAGEHDWPPWRTLWAQWLDHGPLAAALRGACG